MFRRGVLGAVVALAMTATGAQAFQVGMSAEPPGNLFVAHFLAAPWEQTDLSVRASDGGQTITFHDANGIAGKNPPTNTAAPMIPCEIIDQHTARCHVAAPLSVIATLSDAGSRFRDLAPAAGTANPIETVYGGVGNDDILMQHAYAGEIEDAGGTNQLTVTSGQARIAAFNGIGNRLDVQNDAGGDVVYCRVGSAAHGPDSLETPVLGAASEVALADHGVSDTVVADSGDTIDGCENDLGA
jgi:hypothetical protein